MDSSDEEIILSTAQLDSEPIYFIKNVPIKQKYKDLVNYALHLNDQFD